MIIWSKAFWVVILIIFCWSSAFSEIQAVGYFPLEDILTRTQSFDRLETVSNAVLLQRHWKEGQNPHKLNFIESLRPDVAEARKHGLKVIIAMELLSHDRKVIELPTGLNDDFTSETIREQFTLLLIQAAREFQPDIFILNVEANLWKRYDQKGYAYFRQIAPFITERIHAVSPKTKTTVSIVAKDWDETDCLDSKDFQALAADAKDFETGQDLFGVSLYPFCYFNPKDIPEDLISNIAKASQLPLFITETGWISETVWLTWFFPLIGNEERQANYIERIWRSARKIEEEGRRLEGLTYISLIDPSEQLCNAIKNLDSSLSWYCSLAILNRDKSAKRSYDILHRLKP